MTEFYGPLPDSKVATLTQARGWSRGLGPSGVYPSAYGLYSTDFECSDGGGLVVSSAAGEALIDGIYYTSDAAQTVTLDDADPTDPRIDLVVIELDPSAGTVALSKVTGTPDPAPSAPSPTQLFNGKFQIPLAEPRVNAGSATIDSITDAREFLGRIGPGNPADGDALVWDAARGLYVPGSATSGGGAMTLEGVQNTGNSTTSTSAVDVASVTGLNIATSKPIMVEVIWEKSSGAAAAAGIGLKLNSTVTGDAKNCGATSAVDRAEDMVSRIWLPRRDVSGLTEAGMCLYGGREVTTTGGNPVANGGQPAAAITDVVIRGVTDSASVSLAVQRVAVYSLAVS